MTDIAQLEKQPHSLRSYDEERRFIASWRLRLVAFYGALLALSIAFAAISQAPRERQAYRASGDSVSHSISNPPAGVRDSAAGQASRAIATQLP